MSIDLFRKLPQGALRGMPYGSSPKNDISRKNASVDPIIFGHGVFGYKGDESFCMPPLGDTNTVTLSADMVADDEATITVDGETFVQAFDADMATTATKMLAKLNADGSIVATYATKVFTITTKYKKSVITASIVNGGDGTATITVGATPTVSTSQVFIGVALRSANEGMNRDTDYQDAYLTDTAVTVRNLGSVVVEADDVDEINVLDNVYVATDEARKGVFTESTDSDAKRAIGTSFYVEKPPQQDSGDNLVVVTLVGGTY